MPSVAERILAKTPLPTHLDSATIRARVAAEIRQRAFFSARMTSMTYLKQLQTIVAAYAHGEVNAADARWRCQQVLGGLGLDRGGHSLADHGSARRLNLILETQRKMATSVARLDALDTDELEDWPAWRLERYGSRAVPREDWHARWKRAGDACGWVGAVKGDFVALKTSPIWAALGEGAGGFKDTLGNPYPPFAYGSGLDWTDVSAAEATRLGLTLTHQTPQRASLAPDEREILEAMGKTGLRPEDLRALNKRDTHGHFATTEGEPCTHDEKQGEDKKTQVRKVSDAWSEKPAKGSSIKRLKCSRAVGEAFLEDEPETKDSDRTPIIWSRHLIEKYRDGKGRKNGPDPERLTLVAAAVITTRFPAKKVKEYRGEQSFYYREFDGEAIAVFVDNDTRKVNGFMKGTIGEVRDSIGHKYFKKK